MLYRRTRFRSRLGNSMGLMGRTMFGNEADRIARERARQQKRQEDQARDAKRQEIVARLNALVQEIETETSIVLQLEAKRGYPGIVKVHVPGLLGLKSTKGAGKSGATNRPTQVLTITFIRQSIFFQMGVSARARVGEHT